MNKILLFLIILSACLIACSENRADKTSQAPKQEEFPKSIPERFIDRSSLNYDKATSEWFLDKELFSGYMVSYYQDSTLKEKVGILEGRKENKSIYWFPDGELKQVANYSRGKLHGEKKLWSADSSHILITSLNYKSGRAHGVQKQWYRSGELYKKLNMNMGKEDGIQQAFRKNGDLYANYEAKNGRIFGLKKASLCYGIEEDNVIYED